VEEVKKERVAIFGHRKYNLAKESGA